MQCVLCAAATSVRMAEAHFCLPILFLPAPHMNEIMAAIFFPDFFLLPLSSPSLLQLLEGGIASKEAFAKKTRSCLPPSRSSFRCYGEGPLGVMVQTKEGGAATQCLMLLTKWAKNLTR